MIKLSNYKEYFKCIIFEGTEEYKVLDEIYSIITQPLPQTAAESYSRLSVLESYRIQLCSMIFMVSTLKNQEQQEYRYKYEPEFYKGDLRGRTSQAVIEAEIHSKSPELFSLRGSIEAYDRVLSLINSYIRCIDNTRMAVLECWKDAKRL